MSEVIIKLIPKDPEFVPCETKLGIAKDWIKLNFNYEKTEYILTDEVRFIDQGENFENIHCPFCSRIITLDWWHEAMEKASVTSFHDLRVATDCCEKATSLNDLNYTWNAGFSRFSIDIMNSKEELTTEHTGYLGHLLGCEINKVVAYY